MLQRIAALLLILPLAIIPAELAAEDLAARFRDDTTVLAGDEMEGRGLGTKGLARAADWIEKRMKKVGLEPAFGKSFRQPFQIKSGVSLAEGNELAGVDKAAWTPLAASASGAFEGQLAFVGYGIESPQIGYQELSGVPLEGKVALMLRYEPQEKDDASPFDGKKPSRWSALRYKVHQAKQRGAVAVVFVTGPLQDEGNDDLPALKNDGPQSDAGIPVLQVKTSVAQQWLKSAGIDLATFQKEIDRTLKVQSRVLPDVVVRGKVALKSEYGNAENIVGVIAGKGALASEAIVIGAHYDHLGWGGNGSMRPNVKAIHNGADDNASGAASVLLAAELLKRDLSQSQNHRTVVVALFAGEELGLAGSSKFVDKGAYPIEKIVAMVNLDMVGRLRDNQLAALGSESATEWPALIAKAATEANLKVASSGDGYGPSDQTSFYAAGIPVLHLFTGVHEQYHSPDDDANLLNAEGGAQVIRFTTALARDLAKGDTKPKYARLQTPAAQGDSRGYGAYLGTVPDYRAMSGETGGVLLSDVRPGSPAEAAGIKGGDRIVEIAGTKIDNLHDMTFALQDHRPGETVIVNVIRGSESLALRATLSERGRGPAPAQPAATPAAAPAAPAAAPPAMPAAPAAKPADPHAMPAGMPGETKSSFYDDRPGSEFKIGAGKPFEKKFEGEKHFSDVRQLTFGDENAEAYFSPDGKSLIFQKTGGDAKCDRQYILDLATGDVRQVSSGKGRTTCGYFDYPEMDRIVYASTESGGEDCPPNPDRSQGYVWPIYDTYELWEANLDGTNARRLTNSPGYDAEATWCHRGGKLVFTSTRDGDLDLYEMNEAGEVRRLTDSPGYDGGAFYSADCSEIVWRASRPEGEALADYRALLGQNLVRPTEMELFIMKSDGTGQRQLTKTGAANFCPYFHPDGKRIIYASNASTGGHEFDLWMIDKQGGDPVRITTAEGFDGFPMWSPDGRFIVWGSNRANPEARDTNLFIAKWIE